jgi:group I intron endonuclease
MAMESVRKRRSDRSHIIYKITNQVTGDFYIGITVVTGRAFKKSLLSRWKKHITRAHNENHNWNMCNAIRQYGAQNFNPEIFEVIRGKAIAHKRETELIHKLKPVLNSTIKTSSF